MVWSKHTSKSTGKVYFFNAKTGQNTYTEPADFKPRGSSEIDGDRAGRERPPADSRKGESKKDVSSAASASGPAEVPPHPSARLRPPPPASTQLPCHPTTINHHCFCMTITGPTTAPRWQSGHRFSAELRGR